MNIDALVQFFFPKRCSFCGRIGKDPCPECEKDIKFISGNVCKKCGIPIGDSAYDKCPRCLKERFYFDRAIAPFYYEGPVRRGIHLFKYKGFYQNSLTFSKIMAQKIRECRIDFDLIVPVPLSKERFLERGYNQTMLLSKGISKLFDVKCCDILIRTKTTKPFHNLSKIQRRKEIKDTIKVKRRYADNIKGKRILLIDDILTTGVTSNQCSMVLKKAGAKEVYVCVLAITRFK